MGRSLIIDRFCLPGKEGGFDLRKDGIVILSFCPTDGNNCLWQYCPFVSNMRLQDPNCLPSSKTFSALPASVTKLPCSLISFPSPLAMQ